MALLQLRQVRGTFDLGWWLYSPVLIIPLKFLFPADVRPMLDVLYFFVQGSVCVVNYWGCGRPHCKITGPGFLGVGVLGLINVVGALSVPWGAVWLSFFAVLAWGCIAESRYPARLRVC